MKRAIYFTSDQHFGHDNILKFTDRPYKTVKEMNKDIIKKWNKQVNSNDIVYVLGDFVWNTVKTNEYKKILEKLNGNIVLIVGNHDDMRTIRGLNLGFSDVLWGAEILMGKRQVALSHYPYRFGFWKNLWSTVRCFFQTGRLPKIKHRGKRLVDNGKWLLHGHIHGKSRFDGKRSIHVGWDAWGRLVSLDEIVKIMVDNS
jgi:calcineurin-like phosphoesterase family protein